MYGGGHCSDPSSIKFAFREHLNFIICTPYLVPTAKISAAHAYIEELNSKSCFICFNVICTQALCIMSLLALLLKCTKCTITILAMIYVAGLARSHERDMQSALYSWPMYASFPLM